MRLREDRLAAPQTAAARDTKKQLERLGHLTGGNNGGGGRCGRNKQEQKNSFTYLRLALGLQG